MLHSVLLFLDELRPGNGLATVCAFLIFGLRPATDSVRGHSLFAAQQVKKNSLIAR